METVETSTPLALGVLTLGVQAYADRPAYCRQYCAQAIIPFVKTLSLNRELKLSMSAVGVDLEFFARQFPKQFGAFKDLVQSDQIELIPSLYTPFPWWSFPPNDLKRSIRINERCLAALGLPSSPVFMAPGGHLGPNLNWVGGYFDVVVCDERLLRRTGAYPAEAHAFSAGTLVVIAGSGDIGREIANQKLRSEPALPGGVPGSDRDIFQTQRQLVGGPQSRSPHWFHFGGVEGFNAQQGRPTWDVPVFDPWRQLESLNAIGNLSAMGYRLAQVRDFAIELRGGSSPPLLGLVDSAVISPPSDLNGWRRSIRNWNYVPTLALAWRTRDILLASEAAIKDRAVSPPCDGLPDRLEDAWKRHQLGCVPVTGISASWEAQRAGREQAEAALHAAMSIAEELGVELCETVGSSPFDPPGSCNAGPSPVRIDTFGAEVESNWLTTPNGSVSLGHFRLLVEAEECGLAFEAPEILLPYPCPDGVESLLGLNFELLDEDDVILPLPGSFARIGNGTYVIRVNRYWPGPAFVSRGKPWLWFVAEGFPEGGLLEWRFIVVKSEPVEAVAAIAAAVNNLWS